MRGGHGTKTAKHASAPSITRYLYLPTATDNISHLNFLAPNGKACSRNKPLLIEKKSRKQEHERFEAEQDKRFLNPGVFSLYMSSMP